MDLRTLTTFVKVAEEKSFARAARALGMTPSGVSNAIARLEGRMGVELLARTTRSVALTDAGALFHDRCRHALHEIEEAEWILSSGRGVPQGRLRVDLPFTFGRVKIIPLLAGFYAQYPKIKIDISLNDRGGDQLDEGVDVALRFSPVRNSRLAARRLTDLGLCVCGSPEYFRAHGRPATPADLGGHERIAYAVPGGSIREWRLRGRRGSEDVRVVLASGDRRLCLDNADALVCAARAGLGLVQVVRYLVEQELADGRLETVLDDYAPPGFPIWIIHPQSRHLAAKVRVFVDYVMHNYE